MATTYSFELKHYNAFVDQEDHLQRRAEWGASYGIRPDMFRVGISSEKSIIGSIYTRLSVDAASVPLRHVRLDEGGRYVEDIKSGLNECLTVSANLDQAARAFRQDVVRSLFEEGDIAVFPTEASVNPAFNGSFDIGKLRVGNVVEWMPEKVRVNAYNEKTGRREETTLYKKATALVQNPFYSVMNEPNSTLQRLMRKLTLLDVVEEQSSSGKLDMLIQLPYVIKREAQRVQAVERRQMIEEQLKGSQYGIAYIDGTEKVIQLNRPAENNLLKTVDYLMGLLYSQLGLTAAIMDGTAEEAAMINYFNRTIEPVLGAIAEELIRKFLTKTARTQGHTIMYFRDPFKLVPLSDVAEMSDKFSRNEIFTPNEIRQFLGVKPAADPKADELWNSQIPRPADAASLAAAPAAPEEDPTAAMNEAFDGVDSTLDEVFKELESGLNASP